MTEADAVAEALQDAAFLRGLLNSIPAPMFLVDRRVRIHHVNPIAKERFALDGRSTLRLRCGTALRCLSGAENPDGCGHGSKCPECVIRRAVEGCFSGQSHQREKTVVRCERDGDVDETHLLVTASPLPHTNLDLVLLILEDITEVVHLRGLVPICASCKQVRKDEDYWQSVEHYIGERLDVDFTHTICPACVEKLYPQFADPNGGASGDTSA